ESAGAEVAIVAEQAGLVSLGRFAAALAASPGRLLEAAGYRGKFFPAPYRSGTWIAEAHGTERVEAVTGTDGADRFTLACDPAAAGYGLVPNTELARLLDCEIERGAVVVDGLQRTTAVGVFAAGEPCGVAGLETAIAEGEIAGLAATGSFEPASPEGRRLSH